MDFFKSCEVIGPLKGNDRILAVSDIEKADMINAIFLHDLHRTMGTQISVCRKLTPKLT